MDKLDPYYLNLYLHVLAKALAELNTASNYAAKSGHVSRRLERIISLVELEMRFLRQAQQSVSNTQTRSIANN